jgi:hypothetical protein
MAGGQCGEGDIDFDVLVERLNQMELGVSLFWIDLSVPEPTNNCR